MASACRVVWTQYMLMPSSRQAIEYLNIETREAEDTVVVLVTISVHSIFYCHALYLAHQYANSFNLWNNPIQ